VSRGLSRQQLRLLGLATAVSRVRNGAPRAHLPVSHPNWRIPVVTGIPADLTTPLAAHVLGGVALRPRPRWHISAGAVWLETTPTALAVRSAYSRAISSLLRRELVAYKADSPNHGYVLTAAGLDIGSAHELTVPDLARRLWLLDDQPRKERREEWGLRVVLRSPAFWRLSNG